MKPLRILSLLIGLALSLSTMAQKPLSENGVKAQKALIEYLRTNGWSPSIDTRDNSVCFRDKNGVLYWVTFEGDAPILYTLHRTGIKYDDHAEFKANCARAACNEVNRKHPVKCVYNYKEADKSNGKKAEKRIAFIMQTYANNPSDFLGGFGKMVDAFKDVDQTFKSSYTKAYDQWKKDSVAENSPRTPDAPVGKSPLSVTYIAFGNFDATGNVISDYNQPLRKSACRYIKTTVEVSSAEKGIYKIGMRLTAPDGKIMTLTKGVEYCSTANVEFKKVNKAHNCVLDSYGSDEAGFWKAGEYKVEIYDFEKKALLYETTFNIL